MTERTPTQEKYSEATVNYKQCLTHQHKKIYNEATIKNKLP